MREGHRYLFTMWEGGGTLPPQLGVASRLRAAGHEIHVLGDPTIAERAREAGFGFTAWVEPPHRTTLDPDDDVFKDWEASNPLAMLKNARDRFIAGPAPAFAAETAAAIDDFRPHALLADSMILGSMVAGEAARVPVGVLMPNIWMLPTPGMTPVGPGFRPARTAIGRTRDRIVRIVATRIFDGGLPALNAARAEHGLAPLAHLWDQVLRADAIHVLTSAHFDLAGPHLPDNASYLGPILDDPDWAEPSTYDWPEPERPLVLVGLSSTYQDQVPLLTRIVAALETLPVRAVVTLGQMVEPSAVRSDSPHVRVVPSAAHGPLLDEASVAVTHCGHGTTIKALASGTPLVCIPMGRDQNDTAIRVVEAGAGVRLKPTATADRIAEAIEAVLGTSAFGAAASTLAAKIGDEVAGIDVVAEIEALVARRATSEQSHTTSG